MRAAGMTNAEIALRLDVSRERVGQLFKAHYLAVRDEERVTA